MSVKEVVVASYEDLWSFWLDDACYRVGRGARYLDEPSDVSRETWETKILPKVPGLEKYHGVAIRYVGDEDGGVIQVAPYSWVFELHDLTEGPLSDALRGVLLGYSPEAVEDYMEDQP